jgi:DNA-binding response OmpR family regulator
MNGRELAQQVARDLPGVPVLFMSGYSEQFTMGGGWLDTGVQLLEKPFTAHTLLTKVREVLGSPRA